MATEKARHFTFLLYPDSIPEGWQLKLELIGVPIAISPLHDKDKSTVEGQEFKKPHYHGIYVAKNPVTAESVRLKIKRAFDNGKAVAQVQIIRKGIEATYLYLTHESKDALEKKKHIYPKSEILHLNGFDIDRYVTLDVEQKEDILDLVCDVIDEYELTNIRSLRRFIKEQGEEVGLPSIKVVNEVIRAHTGLIRLYFDGVYQEKKYGRMDQKVDEETGELIPTWSKAIAEEEEGK